MLRYRMHFFALFVGINLYLLPQIYNIKCRKSPSTKWQRTWSHAKMHTHICFFFGGGLDILGCWEIWTGFLKRNKDHLNSIDTKGEHKQSVSQVCSYAGIIFYFLLHFYSNNNILFTYSFEYTIINLILL